MLVEEKTLLRCKCGEKLLELPKEAFREVLKVGREGCREDFSLRCKNCRGQKGYTDMTKESRKQIDQCIDEIMK